jgi:hypothetical protein
VIAKSLEINEVESGISGSIRGVEVSERLKKWHEDNCLVLVFFFTTEVFKKKF